ncbi:hypothetical protein EDB81DRAFT_882161 [Dactylonectria macrodidyma]|uniref:Uncharacterized protein n=1 Tax=Dactylonectria macrodidyma TaxID=307937 RepID=A0A9P9J6P8_9HYPO|nr:hypothetical protein EDB81DRAFT_882161 [Dactylonectria macrodidyma]
MGILCTVILTVVIMAIIFSAMNYQWDKANSAKEQVSETIARSSALTTQLLSPTNNGLLWYK